MYQVWQELEDAFLKSGRHQKHVVHVLHQKHVSIHLIHISMCTSTPLGYLAGMTEAGGHMLVTWETYAGSI